MKLIELSETHYIIVDNSDIKEGDFALNVKIKRLNQARFMFDSTDCKKITHSTPIGGLSAMLIAGVRELSLSEVEEAINGYSVEKMAEDAENLEYSDVDSLDPCGYSGTDFNIGYQRGFNAHKELVKDKLFTIEDIFNYSQLICEKLPKLKKLQTFQADDYGNNLDVILKIQDEYIQSLLPKTEWEVKEITPEGKIVLL